MPIRPRLEIRAEDVYRGAVRFGFVALHSTLAIVVSRAAVSFFASFYNTSEQPDLIFSATITAGIAGAVNGYQNANSFLQTLGL